MKMQMLLLEGDDMNQKTGICIILCLTAVLLFGIWQQKRSSSNNPTETQLASETETTIPTGSYTKESNSFSYIIRTQQKRLVVFEGDGKTVYMETGILAEHLNESLQKQAEHGIGFRDQESLFDFLESYSS